MNFIEVKPAPHLQPFIQCFWWMELECRNEQGHLGERILPDGSSEIILHLGDNINRLTQNGGLIGEPNGFFIGQNINPYHIVAQGCVKMLGIKFYPHAASVILRENARQFVNSIVDLKEIWHHSVSELYDRIVEAKDLASRITQVERFLTPRCLTDLPAPLAYLTFAVRAITEQKGQIALSEVAEHLGITPRYLERLFLTYIGILPKLFAQIVQMQNSVRLLTAYPERSLTDIGYASGYYDQSHFIRTVKRLTGVTPTQLRQEKMSMQQPFFELLQR